MNLQSTSRSAHSSSALNTSVEAAAVTVGYVLAIVAAEALVASWGAAQGVLVHIVLLFMLVSHFGMTYPKPYATMLPALVLVPVLRILSFAMPIDRIPELYWYPLIALPLLAAATLAVLLLDVSPREFGLWPGRLPVQLLIALSGLPLAIVAYAFFQPLSPLLITDTLELSAAFLIFFVFVGITEEVVFRGVIQSALTHSMGTWALLLTALLFASAYAGTLSPLYILFMGIVGLWLGWCRQQSGSIWGVCLAHGILSAGAWVVLPYLLG